ncbi:MAG: STAS domain-containing protein [Candidatus Riflebacteria bacterium]|nr:STAS domain-containing protein [Candidatus Riflebacteria bacterium]
MLTVETADRVTILAPTIDRLDAANAAAFRLQVDAHLALGSRVLLDLEKIQFLDSTGLGVILGIFRQLKGSGGELRLCRPGPHVQTLFRMVRLGSKIPVHADRTEALAAFAAPPAA